MTVERVRPAWEEKIKPRFATNPSVSVVGHQNALRALVKVLEPQIEIEKFDLPTATPLVFEFGEKTHRRFFEVS